MIVLYHLADEPVVAGSDLSFGSPFTVWLVKIRLTSLVTFLIKTVWAFPKWWFYTDTCVGLYAKLGQGGCGWWYWKVLSVRVGWIDSLSLLLLRDVL